MSDDFAIKVGDIVTLTRDRLVNQYKPIERTMPMGSKAKVLAVRKPFETQTCRYIDIEFIEEFNPDGSPTRGGNWHAGSFGESWDNFKSCPDGSGEMGFVIRGNWRSLDGQFTPSNQYGQREFIPRKEVPYV